MFTGSTDLLLAYTHLVNADRIPVLDKGYVRLVAPKEGCGCFDDLSVVNAARVSYGKEARRLEDGSLGERDRGLIYFLADNNHTSPFRHAVLSFEVYAPLMVARQWWKYVVGSDHTMDAWNESSRRYVTEEPEFYIPAWRKAPDNKKQGSGRPLNDTDVVILENTIGQPYGEFRDASLSDVLSGYMRTAIEHGARNYEFALANGVAPEQARVFLPAYAMYVRWRWTASLQSVLHFLDQRLGHDAQSEIREYAAAIEVFVSALYPESYLAMNDR